MNHRESRIDESTRVWTGSQDIENGRQVWRFERDGSILAELHTTTQRRYSRWDSSQRISDLTEMRVIVRPSWDTSFTLPQEYRLFGGEVSSLKQFVQCYDGPGFWFTVYSDINWQAKQAGVSDYQINQAYDIFADDQVNSARLLRVMASQKVTA